MLRSTAAPLDSRSQILQSAVFGAIQAGNVFSFVPDVSSAKGAASAIIKLLDSVPEIDSESTEGKKVDPATTRGHIRFENIHFRYPTRPGVRVLRGLSLQIEPGTYIALVGQSGCGKSTVIQMIERFYDPLAGNIYVRPLRPSSRSFLRLTTVAPLVGRRIHQRTQCL